MIDSSGIFARQILLFDSDPSSLNFMVFALRRRGYDTLPAATLADVQALLENEPVTLAICQIRNGDADGAVVLATLRARSGMRAITVTPGALDGLGAEVSFVRPVPIILLLRAVDQMVGQPAEPRTTSKRSADHK